MWWEIIPSAGVILLAFTFPPFAFRALNWIFLGKPCRRWLVEDDFQIDMFLRDERLTGFAFHTLGLEAIMDIEEADDVVKAKSLYTPPSFSLGTFTGKFGKAKDESDGKKEESESEEKKDDGHFSLFTKFGKTKEQMESEDQEIKEEPEEKAHGHFPFSMFTGKFGKTKEQTEPEETEVTEEPDEKKGHGHFPLSMFTGKFGKTKEQTETEEAEGKETEIKDEPEEKVAQGHFPLSIFTAKFGKSKDQTDTKKDEPGNKKTSGGGDDK